MGRTVTDIREAILNQPPITPVQLNPSRPDELNRIIGKALEKNKNLRFQTASDLRADLQRLRRDIESGAVRLAVFKPSRSAPVGRRVPSWKAMAIAATVAAGLGVTAALVERTRSDGRPMPTGGAATTVEAPLPAAGPTSEASPSPASPASDNANPRVDASREPAADVLAAAPPGLTGRAAAQQELRIAQTKAAQTPQRAKSQPTDTSPSAISSISPVQPSRPAQRETTAQT